MTTDSYILPRDILKRGKVSDVHIHFYETYVSIQKQKICLEEYVIGFIQQGEKTITTGVSSDVLDSKHLFILPAGNILMSEKIVEKGQSYQSILLFFNATYFIDFLARHNINITSMQASNMMIQIVKDKYLFHFEESISILREAIRLHVELLRAKIDELLMYIYIHHLSLFEYLVQHTVCRQKYFQLMDIVVHHIDKDLTIEELSFLCNMSVSTFKRKFFEIYQTTPKQYFISHKMRKAIVLLQQQRRPSDIYTELGYEDLSAFSQEFKKYFGVPPTRYAVVDGTFNAIY